jgi:cytochrome c oxidase subunit 3
MQPATSAPTLDAPRTGTWDGGNEPFKASYGKLMMWFFLLSDAFTFAAFLTTYGLIRHKHSLVARSRQSIQRLPRPARHGRAPGLRGVDDHDSDFQLRDHGAGR